MNFEEIQDEIALITTMLESPQDNTFSNKVAITQKNIISSLNELISTETTNRESDYGTLQLSIDSLTSEISTLNDNLTSLSDRVTALEEPHEPL